MDDLLWNGSTTCISLWGGGEDGDCEESFFISDPSCLSPPLQELQTVAEILGLPAINTPAPDMVTVQQHQEARELLAMDSMALGEPAVAASDGKGAADPKFLCDRGNSWPFGASSGGLLLEELENDKGTAPEGGFWDIFENPKPKQQNPTSEKQPSSANTGFQQPATSSPSPSSSNNDEAEHVDREAVARMKAMIYHAATFRPVNLGLEMVEKKRRRNVKTSKEPQTVAARKRREKISEKIRVLQRLVPGGSKMDTASMLDEAASYLKFLRAQIKALEGLSNKLGSLDCLSTCTSLSFNSTLPTNAYFPL